MDIETDRKAGVACAASAARGIKARAVHRVFARPIAPRHEDIRRALRRARDRFVSEKVAGLVRDDRDSQIPRGASLALPHFERAQRLAREPPRRRSFERGIADRDELFLQPQFVHHLGGVREVRGVLIKFGGVALDPRPRRIQREILVGIELFHDPLEIFPIFFRDRELVLKGLSQKADDGKDLRIFTDEKPACRAVRFRGIVIMNAAPKHVLEKARPFFAEIAHVPDDGVPRVRRRDFDDARGIGIGVLVHEIRIAHESFLVAARLPEQSDFPIRFHPLRVRVPLVQFRFEGLGLALRTVDNDVEVLGGSVDVRVIVIAETLGLKTGIARLPLQVPLHVVGVACGGSAEKPRVHPHRLGLFPKKTKLFDPHDPFAHGLGKFFRLDFRRLGRSGERNKKNGEEVFHERAWVP